MASRQEDLVLAFSYGSARKTVVKDTERSWLDSCFINFIPCSQWDSPGDSLTCGGLTSSPRQRSASHQTRGGNCTRSQRASAVLYTGIFIFVFLFMSLFLPLFLSSLRHVGPGRTGYMQDAESAGYRTCRTWRTPVVDL